MLPLSHAQDADTIASVTARSNTKTDEQLAALAARGDQVAQAELVRRYQKPVLGLCASLVNPQDAEDLAQDALVRVLTRLDSFTGQSALGTWIYRVTTNICLSHLRHRRRSPIQNSLGPESVEQIGEPRSGSSVQTGADLPPVKQALDNLTDDQRVILVLRDVRGLDYEQLAHVLDIPIGTVRSRLFRARRALANALERLDPNHLDTHDEPQP